MNLEIGLKFNCWYCGKEFINSKAQMDRDKDYCQAYDNPNPYHQKEK